MTWAFPFASLGSGFPGLRFAPVLRTKPLQSVTRKTVRRVLTDKQREYLNGAGNNDLVWLMRMLRDEFGLSESEATSAVVLWAREGEPDPPKGKPRYSSNREAAQRQTRDSSGRFIPNRYGVKWRMGGK